MGRRAGWVARRAGRVVTPAAGCAAGGEPCRGGVPLRGAVRVAAGAGGVYPPVEGVGEMPAAERRPMPELRASDLTLMAFHPLGTARADARPAHGVVDGELKLHGPDGVYVADGSVVPSSIGANPQITIMALATRLAYCLLGAPPPADV